MKTEPGRTDLALASELIAVLRNRRHYGFFYLLAREPGLAANPLEPNAAEAAKPKPSVLATQATSANNPNAQPFEVTVRAKDRAWVSIKSDGKYTVRGIISPPDVKTVRATDQIVFWTGNAGAVEISFNGQRVPLEGGPNTEGVLVFNSHGVVIPKPAVATQP